jgi:hypothetical protein
MCEYLKLKIIIWNLYVKRLDFEKLKIEMSKFGCVKTFKFHIFKFFAKCLERIWKFDIWNVWILKIEMSKYWKLKCMNSENWKSLIQTHYAYGQKTL